MKQAKYPSINEETDFSYFPHIDFAGRQFVRELEWQLFKNEAWTDTERAWLNYMRCSLLQMAVSYEDAINEAYMRGIEVSHTEIFGDDNEL